MEIIELERNVLDRNDRVAEENKRLFGEKRIFVCNLLSSPGSGKTSILERVSEAFENKIPFGIIVGDVQTDNDARRLSEYSVQTVQIITSGACHLDAEMIKKALKKIDINGIKILFIENVGNLVCPASFNLGENKKIVIMSTTEGEDKPLKYPAMFFGADVMIINKIDLLPYLKCNMGEIKENALKINPRLTFFETSTVTGEGIDKFCKWILDNVNLK